MGAIFMNLICTSLKEKKYIKVNLGEGIVLQLTEKLQQTYFTGYFDNFE